MGRPKAKVINPADLPDFDAEDAWVRFQGVRDALPPGTDGIPDEKLFHVTVSGSFDQPRAEEKYGVSGDVVMGFDVFRHDPKDAPFEFNKDHYFVMRQPDTDEYRLHGPFRKGEPDHWLKEIPDAYADCELLMSASLKASESPVHERTGMSTDRAMEVFLEAFDGMPRLGPGQMASTHRAYRSLTLPAEPRILDVGCGNGRQTLDLAEISPGQITAVDNHAPFLERLQKEAEARGVGERVRPVCMDMAALDFHNETFDLIWSEAAIYNIGFAKGLSAWKSMLTPGGQVAVSEACWLRPDPPSEIERWWRQEYPAITDVETNLVLIREAGYEPLEHFALPPEAWTDEYYVPLRARIEQLRTKYGNEPEASGVLDMLQTEIDQYKKYGDWYGYVFFLMRLL